MLVAVQGSTLLYVLAFSIFWFNLGGWLAIAPAATISMYGVRHYSQNYGVVFTAYGIAAVIGVVTSGIIIDYLKHYHYVFYFIIALCMIGLLISQRFLKNKGS
jgi:MFS family permease